MAGHSKWANIKHKKGAADAKRGKVFTKIAKELVIAARQGGGDPDTNPGLRLILSKARAANMPNKNIERAVKRGTGELEGGELMELMYEGYAPHGVGMIIEVVTDNKNRAVAELRHTLGKYQGSLGEDGSVAWQFTRKGSILLDQAQIQDEDDFFMLVAEAGAEDVSFDETVEVMCAIDDFQAVQTAILDAGIEFREANLIFDPNNTIEVDTKDALQVMKTVEMVEELDDVQNVYTALEITDALVAELA